MTDYDEADWLIDNDPIELGRRYRQLNKVAKLTYISADDWCGLYMDDELLEEGHDIQWDWILEKLLNGTNIYTFESHSQEAYKCIEALGRCPKNLSEVYYD